MIMSLFPVSLERGLKTAVGLGTKYTARLFLPFPAPCSVGNTVLRMQAFHSPPLCSYRRLPALDYSLASQGRGTIRGYLHDQKRHFTFHQGSLCSKKEKRNRTRLPAPRQPRTNQAGMKLQPSDSFCCL